MLAATMVLIFLVAMVAITGIERVKGSPLSGGGSGTSVGSVFGTRAPGTTTSAPSESAATPAEGSEAPTTTTTSGADATSAEPSATEDAPTTTSRSGGGGLVPTRLLPGN